MKQKYKYILILLLLLAGLGILIYPTLSDYVNSLEGSYAIGDLDAQLAHLPDEALSAHRRQAEEYNTALAAGSQPETDYSSILDFGDGLMGYISIPKIDVYLPIYHDTGEEILAKGVGHMPQSAFPIGGSGNHAVLTGHTGLPSAKLFTDLTELGEGDLFYIHILNETLTYQVDSIQVVLPSEAQGLTPQPGEDLCTLVTCTPYGINSHRLLVRGSRVLEAGESQDAQSDSQTYSTRLSVPTVLIAAGAASVILLAALFCTIFKKERQNK